MDLYSQKKASFASNPKSSFVSNQKSSFVSNNSSNSLTRGTELSPQPAPIESPHTQQLSQLLELLQKKSQDYTSALEIKFDDLKRNPSPPRYFQNQFQNNYKPEYEFLNNTLTKQKSLELMLNAARPNLESDLFSNNTPIFGSHKPLYSVPQVNNESEDLLLAYYMKRCKDLTEVLAAWERDRALQNQKKVQDEIERQNQMMEHTKQTIEFAKRLDEQKAQTILAQSELQQSQIKLQNVLSDLHKVQMQSKSELSHQLAKVQSLQSELSQQTSKAQQLQNELLHSNNELQSKSSDLSLSNMKLQQLQKEIDSVKHTLVIEKEQNQALRKELEQRYNECQGIHSLVPTMTTQIKKISTSIAQLLFQKSYLMKQNQAFVQLIDPARKTTFKTLVLTVIAALRIRKRKSSNGFKKLPDQIDASDLKRELDVLRVRIMNHEHEMAMITYKVNAQLHNELRQEKEIKATQLSLEGLKIAQLKQQLSDSQSQILKQQYSLQDWQAKCDYLRETIDVKDVQINTLTKAVERRHLFENQNAYLQGHNQQKVRFNSRSPKQKQRQTNDKH